MSQHEQAVHGTRACAHLKGRPSRAPAAPGLPATSPRVGCKDVRAVRPQLHHTLWGQQGGERASAAGRRWGALDSSQHVHQHQQATASSRKQPQQQAGGECRHASCLPALAPPVQPPHNGLLYVSTPRRHSEGLQQLGLLTMLEMLATTDVPLGAPISPARLSAWVNKKGPIVLVCTREQSAQVRCC